MTSLTFSVQFEVRPDRNSAWRTPTDKNFNTGAAVVIGVPTVSRSARSTRTS